jgi:hypothetical protein
MAMKKAIKFFMISIMVLMFAACGKGEMYDICNDTDYNADGVTNELDSCIFQYAMGSVEGDKNFVTQADHDGDGLISSTDAAVLLQCLGS